MLLSCSQAVFSISVTAVVHRTTVDLPPHARESIQSDASQSCSTCGKLILPADTGMLRLCKRCIKDAHSSGLPFKIPQVAFCLWESPFGLALAGRTTSRSHMLDPMSDDISPTETCRHPQWQCAWCTESSQILASRPGISQSTGKHWRSFWHWPSTP